MTLSKRNIITLSAALLTGCASLSAQNSQHTTNRIERMPAIPTGYMMRDWKDVTRHYVELTLNQTEGEYMPLSRQNSGGINYPAYRPIFMDTYVGGNSHGDVSECINVLPAVVSAWLTGNEGYSSYSLTEGIIDFFNARNGQNVYLNNFSARSGKDWWYDLMPNVYFYQLYQLAPMPDADLASQQYVSVADQWLKAVTALGGDTYGWVIPSMRYRAFDLISMKPLDSGVIEPESAGTIAWILFHAYLETGEEKYRKGAELSMEYLNSLGSNPSYELQLAYGVQAAAKMNAMLGTTYRTTKLFDNCFDRGYLRGWGSIVGNWGGYEMSGLIGEANDNGNDYAFVMNGFQQAAALAPAAKYDKRLARAFARWMLNVASASRFFYPGFLPDANMEPVSLAWSKTNDPHHVIPYEAIKQTWNGVGPYAMGDAIKGGWAATNLSLYSGSSVGYLAAVAERTDVEAILQLDLNATDLDGRNKYPTYLYYNPHGSTRSVTVNLPSGNYRVYDAITETFLTESVSGSYSMPVPSDNVRLITLIPAEVPTRIADGKLYAGDTPVDYHYGYDFDGYLRFKNIEAADSYPVKGDILKVKATVGGANGKCSYQWSVDGASVKDVNDNTLEYDTSGLSAGRHNISITVTDINSTITSEITVNVLSQHIPTPEITDLVFDTEMPAVPGDVVTVTCNLKEAGQHTAVSWHTSDGNLLDATEGSSVKWRLPEHEGIFTITCKASTIKGETEKTSYLLSRNLRSNAVKCLLKCPFDGNTTDIISGKDLLPGGASPGYAAGYENQPSTALSLSGEWLYLPDSDAAAPDEAITISFRICQQEWTGAEQFIVSHGSWQDRYKVSVTTDKKVRWTVKTSDDVADVDCLIPVEPGKYDHYCAVYTGFSAELYRNGQLSSYKPLTGTLGTTRQPITIGSMNADDLSYNYHGRIDDLQIYDGALMPMDIADLYSLGYVGIEEISAGNHNGALLLWDGDILRAVSDDVDITDIHSIEGRRIPTVIAEQSPSGHTTAVKVPSTLARGVYIVTFQNHKNRYTGKMQR